jgi:Fe-S oxidoreductase
MKEDYKCPCEEIDPENFITNEEVISLLEKKEDYKFKQEDYFRVYNCIHCNDCGTSEQRFILKQKYLTDGNKIEGLTEMIYALKTYKTPFIMNKSRLKIPEGIPRKSDTLLYFGCFTTVKTPKYGEDIIKYLLKQSIEFCILEKEDCCGYPILCTGSIDTYENLVENNLEQFNNRGIKKIITVCPSCYMVFKKHYSQHGIKIEYFTEYLEPSKVKQSGSLIIQHACPLKNGEIPQITSEIENLYKSSGYDLLTEIPRDCCGGGVGHQLRIDISEAIAFKRMQDFKGNGNYLKELPEGPRFITTYCPDAYWILKVVGRKQKIEFKLREMCSLLM